PKTLPGARSAKARGTSATVGLGGHRSQGATLAPRPATTAAAPTASIAVLLRSEGPGSGRATSVISPDPRNSNAASRPAVRTVTALRPSVALTGTPTRPSPRAVRRGDAYSRATAPVPAVPGARAP